MVKVKGPCNPLKIAPKEKHTPMMKAPAPYKPLEIAPKKVH